MINSIELLNKALKNKYAVPQFNINNLEWAKYILEECELNKSPVIIGASESAIKYMGGYNTVYSVVYGLIKDLNITIPVVLHLDHGSSVDSCKLAIDAGFTSVMIDASKNEIQENIRLTKEVVDYAKSHNVSVEGEVGYIGINKGDSQDGIMYATVEDSKMLIDNTGINSLAPALGSVHGLYNGKAKLNYSRMEEIVSSTNVPLVLHGGTGISDEDIKKSIECGISKININTELQYVWNKAVREYISNNIDVYDPRKIISSGEKSIKEVVKNKINLFGSNNKA